MRDRLAKSGRPLSVGLLTVGAVVAPVGWLLLIFAVGTRCHPNPCPSTTVTYGFLATALGGTLALGIGGVGSVWYLLQARRQE